MVIIKDPAAAQPSEGHWGICDRSADSDFRATQTCFVLMQIEPSLSMIYCSTCYACTRIHLDTNTGVYIVIHYWMYTNSNAGAQQIIK